MAVSNTLVQKNKKEEVSKNTYITDSGEITLTDSIIRKYLTNGDGQVSDQECMMFIALCKGQKLNPFLKEAYLIKYGNSQPATMVVSKDVYQKRAENNPQYDGKKSGIIIYSDQGIEYRDGTFYMQDEELVGGWCEVYRKDRSHSERVEVSYEEYVGKTKDGKVNSQWSKKPATMIRKVAIAQALREAFPTDLNGMYTAEEMNVPDSFETEPVIDQPTVEVKSELIQDVM